MGHRIIVETMRKMGAAAGMEMTGDPTRGYLANVDPDHYKALFRPHVKYEDGIVSEFDFPTNTFVCDESANLVFFIGKEPNLRWQVFADCLFGVVREVVEQLAERNRWNPRKIADR